MPFGTLIQSNHGEVNAAGISVAFLSNVTKGDLLILATNDSSVVPTDSLGTVYTHGITQPDPFSGFDCNLWYGTAPSTGANTVTITIGVSGVLHLIISEYNIQNAILDQKVSALGLTSGAITTLKAQELIIGIGVTGADAASWTASAGFTVEVNSHSASNFAAISLADQIVAATGTFNITLTPISSFSGATAILSFYAGTPTPTIGTNRYGVKTFLQPQPGNSIPYRLCVNNNRLYCVLPDNTGIFSCFVYYLGRENNQGGYWYRYVIDPAALISEEDGTLFGGFEDAGAGSLFTLDVANVLQFAGTNINVNLLFPQSKNEINQRKDVYHLRFHVDTGGVALVLTGYTDFGAASAFALGTITTNGVQEINLLIQSTNFNLAKRFAIGLSGATPFFKLIDWSIDYENRPEPLSFLRIATNYSIAAKKRIRTIPIVIDTRGNAVQINVTVDGVAYGNQSFTTSDRTTVFYYFNTDVFATDIVINITATNGNTFEYYDAPAPVNVEILPVGKLFDQIGPVELERIGALLEFRVRMMATTNTLTYNVYMDDVVVVTAQTLTVTPNVDKTYGPFKMPKGIQGSVCRVEFLSSNGVFYRWNCKLKFTTGGVKSDTKQITIQDKVIGLQS